MKFDHSKQHCLRGRIYWKILRHIEKYVVSGKRMPLNDYSAIQTSCYVIADYISEHWWDDNV